MAETDKEKDAQSRMGRHRLSRESKKLLARAIRLSERTLRELPHLPRDIQKTEFVQEIYIPTRMLISDLGAGIDPKGAEILLDAYESQLDKTLARNKTRKITKTSN